MIPTLSPRPSGTGILACIGIPATGAEARVYFQSALSEALWGLANFQAVFGNLTGEDARPTLWRGRPRPRSNTPQERLENLHRSFPQKLGQLRLRR